MPNNYEKARKAQEARDNARAREKYEEEERKVEEERKKLIKSQFINEPKRPVERMAKKSIEEYQATPFKNADIDRMNAQKKKF